MWPGEKASEPNQRNISKNGTPRRLYLGHFSSPQEQMHSVRVKRLKQSGIYGKSCFIPF